MHSNSSSDHATIFEYPNYSIKINIECIEVDTSVSKSLLRYFNRERHKKVIVELILIKIKKLLMIKLKNMSTSNDVMFWYRESIG